jgi:hypothetical protein
MCDFRNNVTPDRLKSIFALARCHHKHIEKEVPTHYLKMGGIGEFVKKLRITINQSCKPPERPADIEITSVYSHLFQAVAGLILVLHLQKRITCYHYTMLINAAETVNYKVVLSLRNGEKHRVPEITNYRTHAPHVRPIYASKTITSTSRRPVKVVITAVKSEPA